MSGFLKSSYRKGQHILSLSSSPAVTVWQIKLQAARRASQDDYWHKSITCGPKTFSAQQVRRRKLPPTDSVRWSFYKKKRKKEYGLNRDLVGFVFSAVVVFNVTKKGFAVVFTFIRPKVFGEGKLQGGLRGNATLIKAAYEFFWLPVFDALINLEIFYHTKYFVLFGRLNFLQLIERWLGKSVLFPNPANFHSRPANTSLFSAPETQTQSICSILSDMYSLGMVICAIFNQGRPLIQANNSTSAYLKQLELVRMKNYNTKHLSRPPSKLLSACKLSLAPRSNNGPVPLCKFISLITWMSFYVVWLLPRQQHWMCNGAR